MKSMFHKSLINKDYGSPLFCSQKSLRMFNGGFRLMLLLTLEEAEEYSTTRNVTTVCRNCYYSIISGKLFLICEKHGKCSRSSLESKHELSRP